MFSCRNNRNKTFCLKKKKALYSKCPIILNTKVPGIMAYANSEDPDQTAPEGAVCSCSTLIAIPLCILRNKCIKANFRPKQKVWNKMLNYLGHLPYLKLC